MSEEIGRRTGTKNIRDPLFVPSEAAGRNMPEIYEFGPFRLEPGEHKLWRDGTAVVLTPKVFDMLVILVRNSGHLLDKDELIRSLWPDSFVEEGNLSNNIFVLRKALGNEHEYIETVPRRGYRFVGAVRQLPPAAPNAHLGALEVQRRDVPSHQKLRTRKALFAGVAAAVLALVAIILVPRFRERSSVPAPNQPHLAVEQRLTSNPSDVPAREAVLSPDGRYVAYADPTGLYLRQISSGETRSLSLPKHFLAWPRSWYPDGIHLMVVRIAGQPKDFNLWNPSLYKVSILGGEPQKLVDKSPGGYVSPDGTRIAYLPMPDVNEIWIVDSDGANRHRIVSTGDTSGLHQSWIYPRGVAWSPTGQHLAYIEGQFGPVEAVNTLHIIAPDGTGQTVVLADPRIGEAIWWALDGRIFFSYREDATGTQEDNYGVYSIRFDEQSVKAIGPPKPITRAEGQIGGITGTADGKRLVLWRLNTASQSFLSTYDAATRHWKEPRRLILDTNENLAWAWTADSKAVFFASNRNGTWKLFKQAIDETTPEELVEGRSVYCPRLSADGTQVLYLSSLNPDDVSFPVSLMSKPLAGGPPRVVIQEKGIWNEQCAMTPATVCIFSQNEGQNLIFRTFDLQHGPGRELLRMAGSVNWSLSSDGSNLAIFLDPHRIRFFSVATGATRDITVKDWRVPHGDWGASGKTLFVPSYSRDGIPVILEVDQTRKAKVVLEGKPNTDFGWMIQSPDSRHAVVGERIPTDNNAWILNDF